MTSPSYPGVVFCVGGDMITGAIHDDLRETNDGPVTLSVVEVEEQLIGMITMLADKFGKVFVPCVPGNHGRTTIKPRAKNRVFDSWEWVIYQHLKAHFANDPRVTIHVPNEVDAHFAIYGHRFMLTHGDTLGVKGGDGIIGALGPIARGAIKVGRSEAQCGRDFDTLLIGHYHTYIPRGDAVPVLANGSLIGYNEYARLMLRAGPTRPTQRLAFIHPKRGITVQWPIYDSTPTERTRSRARPHGSVRSRPKKLQKFSPRRQVAIASATKNG
jgi:predicted phosphodiesterase